MKLRPEQVLIYHITDVENLPSIIASGGLLSDAVVAAQQTDATVIGYAHIKQRRMTEIRIDCCDDRFVGEFVPFYYCPRSPMLYTTNLGKTGRPPGCQRSIVHLVSTVVVATGQGRQWAISDGNAGAYHVNFYGELNSLSALDWEAIRATQWKGKTHQKSAEFLVADRFDWFGFHAIGCHNPEVAAQVKNVIQQCAHRPAVTVEPSWYY